MDADRLAALDPDGKDLSNFNFGLIPESERLHPSRRLCGLLKVAELMSDPAKFDFRAEHDVVFLAHADDLRDLTQADATYLSRCGVHYDDYLECLVMYC